MAYFSLHAYDADVWVQGFRGLNQSDTGLNPNPNFAAEEENLETPDGVLQPQAAITQEVGSFTQQVKTLASFHRRWYAGSGSKYWYVCCSGGKFYQRQADTQAGWIEIDLPENVDHFASSEWSWVTYETNTDDGTVDVLLMSNKAEGMIMVVPPDRPSTWVDWSQQDWTYMKAMTWQRANTKQWHINRVTTAGKKFGVIERYGERIWGGDIADNPDMLMYSAPYDPTDWAADPDIPEDGAGDILQPSWDGDQFYALKRFGDHLLAFKKNRVWEVIGLSPGEFQFQEQYGSGTEYFETIAVDNERLFMCSGDGLSVYDGMSTTLFAPKYTEQIWNAVNKSALGNCCGALFKNRYYIAFPVEGSTVNNVLLVYNLDENSILYYTDIYIEALMPTDDALFATTSTAPGKIFRINYDSWLTGKATGKPTRWVSPWIDFGYKTIVKGGFDLYFTPEVQDEPVTMTFKIQTEKKTKQKNYTVYPLNVVNPNPELWEKLSTDSWGHVFESSWGDIAGKTDVIVKQFKQKRLHFSGAGRRFRIIFETGKGIEAPWRLIGGLHLVVETDPD